MSGRGGRGRGGRGRGRGGRASSGGGGGSAAAMSKELLKRSAAEAGLDDRHLKVLSDITQPPLYPAFAWHSAGGYFEAVPPPTETTSTRELAERAIAASGAAAADGNTTTTETKPPPPPAAVAAAAPAALSRIKRATATVYITNKQREMADRFAASAHCVPPTAHALQDVVRYRVPPRGPPDAAVLQQLSAPSPSSSSSPRSSNRKLATDERYFPAELLLWSISKRGSQKSDKVSTSAAAAAADGIPAGEKLLDSVSSDTLPVDPAALLNTATAAKVKREEGGKEEDEEVEDDEEPTEIAAAEVDDVEEEGADYTANYYASDDDDDASAGGDDGGGGEATF